MLSTLYRSDSPFARLAREIDVFAGFPARASARPAVPPVNAWREEDGSIVLEAELPGFELRDVEVLLAADGVTLKGSREVSAPEGGRMLRAERGSISFERSFKPGIRIDAERATASMRDGVLTVRLPVAAGAGPRRIAISQGSVAPSAPSAAAAEPA
jgi:HSP20 family protein